MNESAGHDDLIDLTKKILLQMGFTDIEDERQKDLRVQIRKHGGALVPDLAVSLKGKKYFVECGNLSLGEEKILQYLEGGHPVIHVPYPETNRVGLPVYKIMVYSLGDTQKLLNKRFEEMEEIKHRISYLQDNIKEILDMVRGQKDDGEAKEGDKE